MAHNGSHRWLNAMRFFLGQFDYECRIDEVVDNVDPLLVMRGKRETVDE